jgi:hypothetical protein
MDLNNLLITSLFSREYALQGIVMIQSFLKYHPGASVRILALDSDTKNILLEYFDNQIEVVNLDEDSVLSSLFETFGEDRTRPESIFTLKVFWINLLLSKLEEGKQLVYSDADLYFMGEVADFNEINWSILVSPHFFPVERSFLNGSGLFNAGFIGINPGSESRRIISWWQDRVLEYCGTSKSNGLYADQKYLDSFGKLGEEVRAFRQSGTNTGMWQVSSTRKLTREGSCFFIGGTQIDSFHFHGLRISKNFIRLGMMRYGLPSGSLLVSTSLYRRYTRELVKVLKTFPKIELGTYVHNLSPVKELSKKLRNPLQFLDILIFPFGIRK